MRKTKAPPPPPPEDDLPPSLQMIRRCHQHQWPQDYGRDPVPLVFPNLHNSQEPTPPGMDTYTAPEPSGNGADVP